MMRLSLVLAVAVVAGTAAAGEFPDDQQLLGQAAASRPETLPAPPPSTTDVSGDDLARLEREARIEATMSLARLELVLARQALQAERYDQAARKAQRVLALFKRLPPDMDVSVYQLQAEGILAIAVRQGVDVEALKRDAAETAGDELPPLGADPDLDTKVAQAARVARGYTGTHTPDIDARGDERVLRERALRRQTADRYGYRPAGEIIDREALRVRADERVHYQAALAEAYRDSEARALVEAHESRVIPEGVVSYPPNWPQIVKKREKYAGGVIARSPSWYDKDGREWYVAIYDIHDLIFVPPDFTAPEFNPLISQRNALDRAALRWHSEIFRGYPEDLAAGIPLLRYFGGVDDTAFRGPKYSLERQKQIVELIKAFTGPPQAGAQIIPLAP